jgi:hypothetical protein
VDSVRDLGRVEPWRESLERSLVRRGQATRSRPPGVAARCRGLALSATGILTIAAGVLVLALLVTTLPGGFDDHGAQDSATAALVPVAIRAGSPASGFPAPASGGAGIAGSPDCEHAVGSGGNAVGSGGYAVGSGGYAVGSGGNAVGSGGYVNPLAGAHLKRERIDQGVDYAGTGTLAALGAGRITYVGMSATGWPGAFLEYQLSGGPAGGCFVYYAEGVRPDPRLRVGDLVTAGQMIATIIPGWPTGIEVGWAAGTRCKTLAAQLGEWSHRADVDNAATPAGKSFSALIAALGGPPGKVEG